MFHKVTNTLFGPKLEMVIVIRYNYNNI